MTKSRSAPIEFSDEEEISPEQEVKESETKSVLIQNIFVSQDGEEDTVISYNASYRIYQHIKNYADKAVSIHLKNNFDKNGIILNKNYITRLSFCEFSFFTSRQSEPLLIEEFRALINKIELFSSSYPTNFHMLLASFPVLDDEKTLHNLAVYVQCQGSKTIFTLNSKSCASLTDTRYKDYSYPFFQRSDDYSLPNTRIDTWNKAIPGLEDFTVQKIIYCQTEGGFRFYTAMDICLEHAYGVAQYTLERQLSFDLDTASSLIHTVSHLISSASIEIEDDYLITTMVEQADSDGGLIYLDFDAIEEFDNLTNQFADISHFGTLNSVRVFSPERLTEANIPKIKEINNAIAGYHKLREARKETLDDNYDRLILNYILELAKVLIKDKENDFLRIINLLQTSIFEQALINTNYLEFISYLNRLIKNVDSEFRNFAKLIRTMLFREEFEENSALIPNENERIDKKRKKLIQAFFNNNLNAARTLLANGVEPDVVTKISHETLLTNATSRQNFPQIKLLIEYEVEIDAQNAFGESSLLIAAKNANWEIAKFLVQHSANPDIFVEDEPFISCAIKNKKWALVKILISKGFDPNFKYNHEPLLFIAIQNEDFDLAKLLVLKGADLNALNTQNLNVFEYFNEQSDTEITINDNCYHFLWLLIAKGMPPEVNAELNILTKYLKVSYVIQPTIANSSIWLDKVEKLLCNQDMYYFGSQPLLKLLNVEGKGLQMYLNDYCLIDDYGVIKNFLLQVEQMFLKSKSELKKIDIPNVKLSQFFSLSAMNLRGAWYPPLEIKEMDIYKYLVNLNQRNKAIETDSKSKLFQPKEITPKTPTIPTADYKSLHSP